MTEENRTKGTEKADGAVRFAWTRPREMSAAAFEAFASEAESAVGAGNTALLALVDAALNDPCRLPAYLSLDAESAERFAAGRPEGRKAALAALALLNELAYRKAHGPKIWERGAGVTPCPPFLPPTPHQVRADRMPLYRAANRTWNLAVIFAFYCAVPTLLSLARHGPRAAAKPLCALLAAAAAFAAARALCAALRGGRAKTRKV